MLTNQDLLQVLADYSFWQSSPPQEILRDIKLPTKLHNDLVLLIQGVRRCGKSTLLTQLPLHYNLSLKSCFFCNFEDVRLVTELSDPNILTRIVQLARQTIPSTEPCYFFFDEIQTVTAWEKWLHMQFERPQKNYFIVTGSNSYLLKGDYATSLTGRNITLKLYPFSYAEYKKLFPKNNLQQYIQAGGFPRSLTYEDPRQLLQDYFNDIIYRDVLKRAQSNNAEAIKQVAKIVFESCGSELSYRNIARSTNLSVDTVKSYLAACEHAYLLFSCPCFSFSEAKKLTKNTKYYPIDPGLRHAVVTTTGQDLGKSFENLIFLALKKINDLVYYWQENNKGEVDFVTVNGKHVTPYQVTWEGPLPRHEKALDAFYTAHPHAHDPVYITKENATEFI